MGNAAGGKIAGASLIGFPCEQDGKRVAHEEFEFTKEGRIRLKQDPTMCINVNPEYHFNVQEGKLETGAKVVLWSCQAALHEVFEFAADDKLKVSGKDNMCVNAEGGLGPGSRLIAYECSEGKPADNEAWRYDPVRRVIFSVQ